MSLSHLQIKPLLEQAKTIAVVGASPNPARPSHYISLYLMEQGYQVVPVNPGHAELFGVTCYPDVAQIPGSVDIVNVFRRSDKVVPVVQAALERKDVFLIWLQDGVISPQSEQLAQEAGCHFIMNDCIYRVHRNLMG